jgi:hypothetical protein
MVISRTQMSKQITTPPSKRKKKKVVYKARGRKTNRTLV